MKLLASFMKMKLCSNVTRLVKRSSDSDYVPVKSNLIVGFISNASEESTSSNEEVLDEETGGIDQVTKGNAVVRVKQINRNGRD